MITWVTCVAISEIAPPVPAGTIAAFAVIAPSSELRVDTTGCDWPAGQTERKPSVPIGTTVKLSEYAWAFAGILHALPVILKSRGVDPVRFGPPYDPVGPRV